MTILVTGFKPNSTTAVKKSPWVRKIGSSKLVHPIITQMEFKRDIFCTIIGAMFLKETILKSFQVDLFIMFSLLSRTPGKQLSYITGV